MARLDTSDAAGEFTPMPEGVYPLRITAAEEKTSKKGNVMFEVGVEVVSGQHKGKTFRDWIMLSGKAAAWHAKKLEQLLGRELNDGDEVFPLDLQNAEFWGYVKHNSYETDGKQYTGYQIDATAGPFDCGYVPRAQFPWPRDDNWTPPGVVAGPPDEHTNDDEFADIPFALLFAVGVSAMGLMA